MEVNWKSYRCEWESSYQLMEKLPFPKEMIQLNPFFIFGMVAYSGDPGVGQPEYLNLNLGGGAVPGQAVTGNIVVSLIDPDNNVVYDTLPLSFWIWAINSVAITTIPGAGRPVETGQLPPVNSYIDWRASYFSLTSTGLTSLRRFTISVCYGKRSS